MDIDTTLRKMTVEEKAALVSGTDFMYTNPIPRLGVPELSMSDGPHGLRKQKKRGNSGVTESECATAFPTAACTASGWNPENLRKMGEAIAEECRYYGVNVLLGPAVNLKRNPLCGRNFEYFSEDPYLSGVLGAAMVSGLQSRGVGASLKHFALNNSENYRFMGNSVVSENAARKLYFRPFEYIVKHAKPASVMCAYNQINGRLCSENRWLLTDILRKEWGYQGLVLSDWGAVRDRIASLKAGMDLEMPGDTAYCRRQILDAVSDGSLPEEVLDQACRRVLEFVNAYAKPAEATEPDWKKHHLLAAEIAADCAVLLKNDGVLPLSGAEKMHISGELFKNMRYQGAGSSLINPTDLTTPEEAFQRRGIRSVSFDESDLVLYFAGLTDFYESEGCDREHMRLPEEQLREIDGFLASGKKVVIVLFGGAPVELPFFDRVSAILNMYLPGQNGGTAVCDLLFGDRNPSGKLAETWPLRYEDVPGGKDFGKGVNEVYAEGLEVGYRYYGKHQIPVRFSFGYGLSYTTFEKTEWTEEAGTWIQTIKNTGTRAGAEVAQLFLDEELRGFKKVYLAPGESETVRIVPEKESAGAYSDEYTVPPEPVRFPVTLESRFTDFRQSFMGRILYRVILSIAGNMEKETRKKSRTLPDGPEKDNMYKGSFFLRKVIENNSPRSLSMSAGTQLPYNFAEGFVELANGHLFKALRCFLRKIRVPKLPKEEQEAYSSSDRP